MWGQRGRVKRIGWVITDQLERSMFCRSGNLISGGVGLFRYLWLASHVNTTAEFGLRHEIYRPWRQYDALVFLKSMGRRSIEVLLRCKGRGSLALFDANVNYYERWGREYYRGMLPTDQQIEDAIEITRRVDGVIADSEFLLGKCRDHNSRVAWVPDSVRMELVPNPSPWRVDRQRLRLLWSGEAVKLFELLAIEDVLVKFSPYIELLLITNAFSALNRWHGDQRQRFKAMLNRVPHMIVPIPEIPRLLGRFAQGGVFISPRFLDNSYNLGHTELKITLPMACGRMALCSPVPSYVKVAERAGHRGIRICETREDWEGALDAILAGEVEMGGEEEAAREVVETHYSTAVVAGRHSDFLRELFGEA